MSDSTPTTRPGMTGPIGTVLESARQTLHMLRYRRTLWWTLPGFAALAVLTYVAGLRAPERVGGADIYCVFAWWALGSVVVPWSAAFLGVQAVHGEIEDRTSQYLFLRPVWRTPLLLGKWLAVSLVAAAIAWASAAAMYFGLTRHEDRWFDGAEPQLLHAFGWVMSLGAVAYTSVAILFGVAFRRPLAWSAFFIVGLQLVVANLPISAGLRQLTVTDPMRRLVIDLIEPSDRLGRMLWPFERAVSLDDLGAPVLNLLVFTGVCLTLACVVFARTEYESRGRD